MRFKVVISENVVHFGDAAYSKLLHDMYFIIRMHTDPSVNGWKIRRERQYIVLMLKSWIYEMLGQQGIPPAMVVSTMDLVKSTFPFSTIIEDLPQDFNLCMDRVYGCQ